MGVKIGDNCIIACHSFGSEPYLIEIGNHVAVASGTRFITHDGGVWIFRKENPKLDLFGKIKIDDNSFVGIGCIILPNTSIGKNCVIGAGSSVRGTIPDNSVVIGNPGKIIMKTSVYKLMVNSSRGKFETNGLPSDEKKNIILNQI